MNYDPITHQQTLKLQAGLASLQTTLLQKLAEQPLLPINILNVLTSRSWTAPLDGVLVVRAMGAGGGGARGTNSTGGYSAVWGVKTIRLRKGDIVTIHVGAGGLGGALSAPNGSSGGDTTVTIHGQTYIAYGGPGGVFGAAAALPDGPTLPAHWDYGAASVKPGWVNNCISGGAGVDILAQGGNATTSDAVANAATGGGGTGSPSEGGVGGGALGTATALGQLGEGIYFDAGNGDWGISFYGGSRGANGGGGSAGASGRDGGTGGGGGAAGDRAGNGGKGGLGAGGGATYGTNSAGGQAVAGPGGNGYAHLQFFALMEI